MEMERFGICDLHGHFLPGMDDGCKNPEESIQVLKSAYEQGIDKMFATPHYYPVETVQVFLKRRDTAHQLLHERMEREDGMLPEICMGAEVAYRPGLSHEEDLEQLCLGHSRYLLLEMPFRKWNSDMIRDVGNIISSRGIIPILAHIERYLPYQSTDALGKILDLHLLAQMNAETLLQLKSRRQGRTMLKNGIVQLLGSDCHNMTNRSPNLGPAIAYLQKKGMDTVLEDIASLSQRIFAEAMGV